MIVALVLLLQIPQPMPVASLPPADAVEWFEFAGSPALWERERFATRQQVMDCRDFNRRHGWWLSSELDYETDARRRSIITAWHAENRELFRVWDLLDDAWCPGFPPWRQRVALARLRDTIGLEAFNAGRMPPCVPVWRFRELKP